MTDIASLGIQIDTRQVLDGTKALDALGDTSARVESKVDSATKALGGMGDASANVWRRGGEATKGMDALGDATAKVTQRITVSNGQMSDTAKILQMQAEQSKAAAAASAALGTSTSQLTLGQQSLIEKFREQATVLGMSRSQLMAYQAAQMGVSAEVAKSVAAFKAQEDAIKSAAKAKDDAAKSSDFLASAVKLLAAAYGTLKVAEYVKDAAMMAARYETLGVVMEVVGRNAGYTKVQMQSASEGIARQGITMIEARESAVKLVQAHVDLQHASELARIAQNAAVIGHINSSEAFDRLVNGIARGNVLILRNIGINVNLQSAYAQMADTLGKTTKELTENERVEARRIAVFERGVDINGVYERSMDTAGKQILSMQRYTQDLKTKFGEVFNETLTIGVMALTDHLKDTNGMVSELSRNNQLEEWGHTLTKVFVTLANEVGNAYTTFAKFDTWARHLDARKAINADFDAKSKANSDAGAPLGDSAIFERNRRIESLRQAALAQENVDYVTAQANLSGNFDRFAKAAEEREKTRTAKKKAEADERLKIDQDYADKATALNVANAGKSLEAQRAAQMKLYKDTYVGTPSYRDTEGRDPKPKIDQAENTRLADALKRIDTQVAAEKAGAEYMMRIDEMRHKAGELGDAEFYSRRRGYIDEMSGAEISGYNKQLADLRAHHNSTEEEVAKNAKAIHDIEDKKKAAQDKYGYESLTMDEEDRLRQKAVISASDDAANKYIASLNAQIATIEAANGKRAESASSIAAETAAQLRAAAALMAVQAAGPDGKDHTQADADAAAAMLVTLNLQADAQERIAAALRDGEAASASRKLADQAIGDWQRVGGSIADSLTNAFGTGGKAIGQMFKAYAEGQSAQLRAQKELNLAKKLQDNDPEKVEAINRAQLQGTQAQLKSYGDMADAAQGFFEQGSRGYQAMHAASMVLHGAEVALSLVKGVNAVLTQGEGDPYSAFARMAAMAAIVVGLGVALTGGGGADTTAKDRQAANGTGTVFGDSTAKSDSIARSIALSAANSNIELTHTAGMLAALRNIESSLSGLGNVLIRSSGLTGALQPNKEGMASSLLSSPVAQLALGGPIGLVLDKLLGGKISGFIGKIGNAIFGGNTTSLDTGLTATKSSLGSVLAGGVTSSQYNDTKTDGGFFRKDKYNTQTTFLGAAADQQLTSVFKNMASAIGQAGTLLGVGGDSFTRRLNSFVVDIGKISLKGLTGDEIQKALEAAFSKVGDDMAKFAVGGLESFAKVGEGYLETLTRIASDYANVDSVLESIGMSFGAVGLGSISARENLISLAGGIDQLASHASGFASNFLTQAEQLAPVQKYVTDQLAAMGLSGIKTRDDFKKVVLGLDLTQPAAQQTYASLMALQDAFAKTHAAAVDLTKSESEIADERKDLQKQIDQLTLTSVQLRAKERLGIDASNLAMFDMITNLQNIASTSDALKTSIDKLKAFKDGILSFRDSLTLGSLSTLTPMQKAAEAQRQYQEMLEKAKAGDSTAQAGIQAAASAYLTANQVINASSGAYVAASAQVQSDLAALAAVAGKQLSDAEQQLAAYDAQLNQLRTLNATASGIEAALTAPARVMNWSEVGTSNMAPLVEEIKGLRADNAQLRTDNATLVAAVKDQTAAVVNATLTASAQNAEAVTEGSAKVAAAQSWKQQMISEAER